MKFIKIILIEIIATCVLVEIAAGTTACYKACVKEATAETECL